MITYQRDQQQTIPDSEVIIVGIGGAGANIIDRVALDGVESAQQLALNTDTRRLGATVAKQKIQMGVKLTRGLGCGGDPELGIQAAMEVEDGIRDALRGHQMVFVCVGLGGGTGSGAAPLVTRIAREQGAFVVVFGTMPFNFEGKRRREQAEIALNELSVLANALVTFDNGRMGELVLASQGIHEAFAAADNMISESIRAVTRLVIKPGLINVGLDDLMSSLRATRSRCLFGSGIASGEDRSQTALKNALNSPLLDKGRLLKNTQTALVHVCGGGEMTLYEVELLMRELTKVVPKSAHILFGAAVDQSMGDSLSVTIISSLPEEHVIVNESEEVAVKKPSKPEAKNVAEKGAQATPVAEVVNLPAVRVDKEQSEKKEERQPKSEVAAEELATTEGEQQSTEEVAINDEANKQEEFVEEDAETIAEGQEEPNIEALKSPPEQVSEQGTAKRRVFSKQNAQSESDQNSSSAEETKKGEDGLLSESEVEEEISENEQPTVDRNVKEEATEAVEEEVVPPPQKKRLQKNVAPDDLFSQGELSLDGGPRGKFEGESPNIVDGEDLDIPPFLRHRK